MVLIDNFSLVTGPDSTEVSTACQKETTSIYYSPEVRANIANTVWLYGPKERPSRVRV